MKTKLRLLCVLAFSLCALCGPALAQADALPPSLGFGAASSPQLTSFAPAHSAQLTARLTHATRLSDVSLGSWRSGQGILLLAQSDALSSPPAAVAAPWYTSATLWTTFFGVVSGLVAIWRNNAATTSAKINQALVLGIEQATKIPQVAQFESTIKQTIQTKAEQLGIQPLLHRIVQDLTEPAATAADKPLAS